MASCGRDADVFINSIILTCCAIVCSCLFQLATIWGKYLFKEVLEVIYLKNTEHALPFSGQMYVAHDTCRWLLRIVTDRLAPETSAPRTTLASKPFAILSSPSLVAAPIMLGSGFHWVLSRIASALFFQTPIASGWLVLIVSKSSTAVRTRSVAGNASQAHRTCRCTAWT